MQAWATRRRGRTKFIGLFRSAIAGASGRANLQPRLSTERETKGSDPMTDSVTELYDEVLSDEVSDAALEIAGSKMGDGAAASVTLAFCSGLDTCPSSPRK